MLFSKYSHNASEVILLSKYLLCRCPIANLNSSLCIIYLKINSPIEPMHVWAVVLTLLLVLDGDLQSKCRRKLMCPQAIVKGVVFCITALSAFLFMWRLYIWDQFQQIMTHCTTEWYNGQGRNDSFNNHKLFIADSRGIQLFLETLLLEPGAAF